jgi:hypothetical protein
MAGGAPAAITGSPLPVLGAFPRLWRGGSSMPLAPVESPAGPGARLPRLASLPGGGTIVSRVEAVGPGHALRYAILRNGRWERNGEAAPGHGLHLGRAVVPSRH